jgi:DNA-binding response OmpR family regulator
MCAMNAGRVLVVDDELSIRRLMRLYLTKAGFTVEEASRVAGLEIGADDYVVKPFLAHEVVARVRGHVRRARGFPMDVEVLRVGKVELDRRARSCTVASTPVELTRREFDLLETLLANQRRAFTRRQLLAEVWGSCFVSEKTVDVHIVGLRRKLGDTVRISTLRGVGYRLEPDD